MTTQKKGICIDSYKATPKDIIYLASVGCTLVRIQLKASVRMLHDKVDIYEAIRREIYWAGNILTEIAKHPNMTSIIAMNYLTIEDNVDDKNPLFWSDPMYIDNVMRFIIDFVAQMFSHKGSELWAYECIGEPAIVQPDGTSITPPAIESFYQRCIDTIRKYDATRKFLLSFGAWGKPQNFKNKVPYNITDKNVIYGFHMYQPFGYTHQGIKDNIRAFNYPSVFNGKLWDTAAITDCMIVAHDFSFKYGYEIYVGEFNATQYSPNIMLWLQDVIDAMNVLGFHWTYYAYLPEKDEWNPMMQVPNYNSPPEQWTLKNSGRASKTWKYLISKWK